MERVQRLLKDFGLSYAEAEVYIFLAKKGTSKAIDLANSLNLTMQQLAIITNGLKKKGAIGIDLKQIVLYTALDFEEMLNRYIKHNLIQAKEVKEKRQELISIWNDIQNCNNDDKN